MGLFSKKEKDSVQVEMTSEQKNRYVMSIIYDMLLNTDTWKSHYNVEELNILRDPAYVGVRVIIDEFDEIYKKVNDIGKKYDSNYVISTFYTNSKSSLGIVLSDSSSKINTIADFETVYDELIKDQITKSYNQIRCMEVLENDNLDQYYDYSSRINHNNYINRYKVLSPITENVIKEMTDPSKIHIHADILASNNRIINQCLQEADNHARKLRIEEQRKEQERINRMNNKMAESMFSSITKANEIERMLQDNKRYSSDSTSIDRNKSRY